MDEATIRQKALERIKTPRLFKLENDYPPGVNMNDVFDAINEVPIEELLTSNGELTRRDVILRRCIKYVASKGLVEERILRKDVVRIYTSFIRKYKKSQLGAKYREPIIHFFQNEASIDKLLSLYNGSNIDTDKLLRLVDEQASKIH